jgi:hypothetical protein
MRRHWRSGAIPAAILVAVMLGMMLAFGIIPELTR